MTRRRFLFRKSANLERCCRNVAANFNPYDCRYPEASRTRCYATDGTDTVRIGATDGLFKLKYSRTMTEFREARKDVPTRPRAADKRVNTRNAISALMPDDAEGSEQQPRRGLAREDVHPFVWSQAGKKSPPRAPSISPMARDAIGEV